MARPALRHPAPSTPGPATLAGLAGYYVTGWGPGLTLKAEEGKLLASLGGGASIEAKFLPTGEFYLYAPTSRFSVKPEGHLAERQGVGGLELLYTRTERAAPTEADLAALAGRYRSDEIDSTYQLSAAETGLTVSCLRFPPLTLTAADRDSFDGPFARLTIVRDAGGAPAGFTMSTGRVRGLSFHKID